MEHDFPATLVFSCRQQLQLLIWLPHLEGGLGVSLLDACSSSPPASALSLSNLFSILQPGGNLSKTPI